MARKTFDEIPSATSYSPRSFVCVNSSPELNMRPSIVLGRAVKRRGFITKRVLSTTRVMRSAKGSTVPVVVVVIVWKEGWWCRAEVEGPGRDSG